MAEHHTHPLIKEVPGHLLQFEEKIFGMTLTQLLTDLSLTGITLMLTASLPLVVHLVVSIMLVIVIVILVHGKMGGYTMLFWVYLLARFWLLPRHTVWRPRTAVVQRGELRGVQEAWLPFHELEQGIMGMVTARRNQEVPTVTYWSVFQVESAQNVRFLAEVEQVTIYERFKRFLDGLGFPLKCLSLVEQVDPHADPALVAQREVLLHLEATPQLRQLQQASMSSQEATLAQCTMVKHFVVVSASTAEVTQLRSDGTSRSALSVLWKLFSPSKQAAVSPEQVKQELRVRISLVKKALQQLDTRVVQLDDQETLRTVAAFLTPGMAPPSFAVQALEEGPRTTSGRFQKRVEGVHTAFAYRSPRAEMHLEPNRIGVADLLAPSAVTLQHDAMEVNVPHCVFFCMMCLYM